MKRTPEEIRLPLVFLPISDLFARQWISTTYGQLKPYNDFKKSFTDLIWDGTGQLEIGCVVYHDRYNYRSGESFSEHYIRYSNMASMLSPAMSDKDLLIAVITHYEPSVQICLISANLKSTQEAHRRISQGQRNCDGGQGRPNDGTDPKLNAAAKDFIPCSNQRRDGSRSP